MSKRINGEGTVFKVGPKKWMARVTVTGPDGKRKYRSRRADSQRDAFTQLETLREEYAGVVVDDDPALKDFLNMWLKSHVATTKEAATLAFHTSSVNDFIVPLIGKYKLNRITRIVVQSWTTKLIEKGVGDRTRQKAFQTLSSALGHAWMLGLIKDVPTKGIERPKWKRKPIDPFDQEEAKTIIEETKEDRYHALYVLALTTGMRGCELFGLRWMNVDMDQQRIAVCEEAVEVEGKVIVKEPKSRRSIRTLKFNQLAKDALTARQRIAMKEGQAANPLVFPAPKGGYIHRTTFRAREWKPLLELSGLRYRGFHHLRHTYATHAIRNGVPIVKVSEILGHHSASYTLDTYASVIEADQDASIDVMTKLFG